MSVSVSRVRVDGPLARWAPGFVAELEGLRYAPSSAHQQVKVLARLSAWLAGEGLDAWDLTPVVVARFVAELRGSGYRNPRSWRGFGTVLGYLRRVGAVPVLAPLTRPPLTAEQELLDRYRRCLTRERGSAQKLSEGSPAKVRRFLAWRVTAGGLRLEELTAADVSAFVLAECPGRSRHWGRQMTLSLRSFLVFLHVDGVVGAFWRTRSRGSRAGGWRGCRERWRQALLSGWWIPATGPPTIGRRDFAVLLLLWRLALRRGEVAAMKLEDIDWRAGELRVCGKSRRVERLPVPRDVGRALTDYLRGDRPSVEARAVFVSIAAPHRPLTPRTVGSAVAAAAGRVGVSGVTAHRLRHTAATDMLREGASLTEIGQVLRHRRPETTAIYAKADVDTLRSLARPWPGAAA